MSEPDELRQIDATHVLMGKRRLAFFAGCDYYRLSRHPRITAAVAEGLKTHGLSVAASRVTTGNHPLYREVEQALERFFGAQSATVVSTGYLADLVVAEALAGEFSHAVLDSAAHPALQRAAALLECPVMIFEARSISDFAWTLARCGREARPIVLTDGMFARNGAVAPLRDYLSLLPKSGMLLVDDAHGAGVIGKAGRGSLEHCGIRRNRIIQTITLSKAFGVFGGAVLGDEELRGKILRRSAMFVGSTPPPLPLMSAVLESLRLCRTAAPMRAAMRRNSNRLKRGLRKHGFQIGANPGPIVALKPADSSVSRRVRQALLAGGLYPSLIHYPGVPKSGYYRFVISSEHSPGQIDRLMKALRMFKPGQLLPV